MTNKLVVDYTLLGNQKYKLEFVGGYENSKGIDVALAEDVTLHYGEYKICSLGFTLKLPKDYKADLRPRSSTFKKYGVIQANHLGLFDTTYGGINDVWSIPLFRPIDDYALGLIMAGDKEVLNDTIVIPKGTRIGQLEIIKAQENVELNLLSNEEYVKKYPSNRGGFGSTGER